MSREHRQGPVDFPDMPEVLAVHHDLVLNTPSYVRDRRAFFLGRSL